MRITIDLVANTATFNTDIQRSTRNLEREMRRAEAESRRRAEGIRAAITSITAAFIAPVAGAIFGGGFVRLADEFENVSARLRLATRDSAEFGRAQTELFRIAQDTSSAFGETADLYARLATSTQSLGLSQQQLLGITETINQAVQLSGTSAEAANAALVQLGQGFASGTLRGEELNSVLEQTPRLARAIADGLGVQVGELRKLAEQGKITSEAVVNALTNQANVIESEFGQVPQTVGRALTQLNNVLLQTVGQINQASGITREFASALSSVAQSIESGGLRTAIDGVATAVGFLIRNFDALSIYLVGRLALPPIIAGLAAAYTALAASLAAASVATGIFGAAAGAATVATTVWAAALRGLTAAVTLLGGPAGVLALAAAGIYLFVTSESEAERKTKDLTEAAKQYNGEAKIIGEQARKNATDLYRQLEAQLELNLALQRGRGNRADAVREIAKIEDQLSKLAVKISESEFADIEFSAPAPVAATAAVTTARIVPTQAAEQAIAQIEDWRRGIEDARGSLTDLNTSLRDQTNLIGLTDTQALAYRLTLGDLSDEVATLGAEGQTLAASLLSQQAAYESATAAAERLAEGHRIIAENRTPIEEYNAELEKLTRLLREGAIDPETYSRAIDRARESIAETIPQVEETSTLVTEAFSQAARNIQSLLADSLVNGFQGGLRGALSSLTQFLAQAAAQVASSALFEAGANLLKDFFGGGDGEQKVQQAAAAGAAYAAPVSASAVAVTTAGGALVTGATAVTASAGALQAAAASLAAANAAGAASGGGGGGGLFGSILNAFGSAASASFTGGASAAAAGGATTSQIGSGINNAFSGIEGFGGFFADGGRPPLGKVSIVGERGPELFVPDSAGTIIPNSAMMPRMQNISQAGRSEGVNLRVVNQFDDGFIYNTQTTPRGEKNYRNLARRNPNAGPSRTTR